MLVVVIMLNLLVSLLNDLYEELKSLAKADWCRAQVRSLLDNAMIKHDAAVRTYLAMGSPCVHSKYFQIS